MDTFGPWAICVSEKKTKKFLNLFNTFTFFAFEFAKNASHEKIYPRR